MPNRSLPPVVYGPIATRAALVTGTSAEAAGTVTNVLRNGVALGTTPVLANGPWSFMLAAAQTLTSYNVLATGVAPTSCSAQLVQTVTMKQDCPVVNGLQHATATDPDGAIANAAITSGTLPAGISLNPVDETISVTDHLLAPASGNFSAKILTTDVNRGITFSMVGFTIISDTEAVYYSAPARNWYDNLNGSTLAAVTDADGAIVSAALNSAAFPASAVALDAALMTPLS